MHECLWHECQNRSGRLEQRPSPEVGDLVLQEVFKSLFDHSIEILLLHSNGADAIRSDIKCHLSQGCSRRAVSKSNDSQS